MLSRHKKRNFPAHVNIIYEFAEEIVIGKACKPAPENE